MNCASTPRPKKNFAKRPPGMKLAGAAWVLNCWLKSMKEFNGFNGSRSNLLELSLYPMNQLFADSCSVGFRTR